MATVIDSLVVTLGLDASQFTKGKTDANKGLEETKEKANNLGGSLKDVAKGAAEFFVALKAGQAIKQFIIDITNSNAQLELMSKNLGINVGELQSWGNIAQQSGGSVAGMQGTMDMLSKSMTEMQLTGETGILPYMRALGVSMYDTSGKARPLNDMLLDMASKFGGMDRTQANNLGRMMGIDQGTMNTLLQGRQAVELMIKRQKEMGLVTKEEGEQSLKLKAAWYRMTQTMTASGRDLVSIVTPALTEVFNAISDAFEWMESHKAFMTGFFSALSIGIGVLLLPVLRAATVASWEFTASLLANPITWVIGLVLALAAAIGLLYDDYQTFKEGGNALIDWADGFKGLDAATAYVRKLADALSTIYNTMMAIAKLKFPKIFGIVQSGVHGAESGINGVRKGINYVLGSMGSKPAQESYASESGSSNPLANLIAKGEGGYNSVNLGATHGYQSSSMDLGHMTIAEIMRGQASHTFNAVGRYQMIGSTLKAAVAALGLSGTEKFNSGTQDRIFNQYLVGMKRKKIADYISGKSNDANAAILDMSKEWASVANPNTGKSYYAGVGNNRSSINANQALASLNAARANYRNSGTSGPSSDGGVVTNETHIGSITVNTQATDAHGVAVHLDQAIKNQNLVNQADYGAS